MFAFEQVQAVMNQTGADETTARAALKTSNGDVAIAVQIIQSYTLKDNPSQQPSSGTGQTGADQAQAGQDGKKQSGHQAPDADDIIEAIKDIWKRGNASRLDIEKQGRTVLSVSLVVGTIGFVLVPVAALIGLGAALITEYIIKIILDDGTVINVNEFAMTRKQSKTPKDAGE